MTTAILPDFDRGVFMISSTSRPGTVHEAWLAIQGSEIRVACTCPAGRHRRHGMPVPCKHARQVCELLEANHLAHPDGARWVTGPAEAEAVPA